MSFPDPGAEVTHLLVVSDIDAARDFYRDVVDARPSTGARRL